MVARVPALPRMQEQEWAAITAFHHLQVRPCHRHRLGVGLPRSGTIAPEIHDRGDQQGEANR